MNDADQHHDLHQEEDIVPWRKVIAGFMGVLALSAAMTVAAWASLRSAEATRRPSGVFPERELGPRRSITEVQQDLFSASPGFGQRLNEQRLRSLSTFSWVDRERRIARVPIDQAMDLVVEDNRR